MKRSRHAALFALLVASRPAIAQPDAIEEHVRRGVALRLEGRDDEARVAFEAAYALRPEPRIAAQLGLACQAAGDWVRADARLREALTATGDPWIARNRAALEGALTVGERHLATVQLLGNVPGARLRVNGREAGSLPLAAPLRVLAGSVSIEVSAEGYEPLTLRFIAAAGESLRERAELRPVPAPAPAPVPVPPPAPAPSAVMPWRALAVGAFASAAVMVVGGTTAIVLRERFAADYNAQCDAGDARGGCGDLRDRTAALGASGWVTLPLGAALAAVGVVFWTRDRPAPPRASSVRCGLGPGSAHCSWTF